jgi:hypothetical protein
VKFLARLTVLILVLAGGYTPGIEIGENPAPWNARTCVVLRQRSEGGTWYKYGDTVCTSG